MGNFESCLSSSPDGMAGAKYCLSHVQFESLLLEAAGAEALTLSIGTCLPAACSGEQLSRWLDGHLQELFGRNSTGGVLVQEQDCSLVKGEPMGGLDWFAV